jgi:hypothetical protein
MPMRLSAGAVCAALVVATSCSSATGDGVPTASSVESGNQSWACIQTVSMTALTTGSSVGEARNRLRSLADDSTLSDRERAYFEELLSALASKADDDVIGNALDDVPCDLT